MEFFLFCFEICMESTIESNNKFFISCKESRIENNRSFYGCFYLGPFDAGQSLTIANALRRTLLSELSGVAITSVQIEGALHEYSNLPGIRESVLDILLNLKEIVLKKTYLNSLLHKQANLNQIGYLKVRGPGVVRASDLKLPPSIQCVDPEQYIATLCEDGVLNLQFSIHEGKNYMGDSISSAAQKSNTQKKFAKSLDFHELKKRRSLLKKITTMFNQFSDLSLANNIGTSKINSASNSGNTVNSPSLKDIDNISEEQLLKDKKPKQGNMFPSKASYTENNLLTELLQTKPSLTAKVNNINGVGTKIDDDGPIIQYPKLQGLHKLWNNLPIDAVFMPVYKVNYIIESNEQSHDNYMPGNLSKFNPTNSLKEFSIISSSYGQNPYRDSITKNRLNVSLKAKPLAFKKLAPSVQSTTVPQLKRNIGLQETLNKKHNIILEVWTNGSIHPRQAIYEALKNLLGVFMQLYKVQNLESMFKSPKTYQTILHTYIEPSSDPSLTFSPKQFQQKKNNFKQKQNVTFELIDIGSLNISLRPYTCLKRSNIHTIGDLLKYTKKELLGLKNFGKRSLEEVEKSLELIGLQLG
nr:RNA polymerase alpha subunit [Chlorosarcina stigmatica]